MMSLKRFSFVVALLVVTGLPTYANDPEEQVAREYGLKSGYIANFARYTVKGLLNDSVTEPLVICGSSRLFVDIADRSLSSVTVYQRPIVIQILNQQAEISGCNIIFLDRYTSLTTVEAVISKVGQYQMLIGETANFLEQGGHIRFFLRDGKIRFEIAVQRLSRNGITLSSKLLRLGLIYED